MKHGFSGSSKRPRRTEYQIWIDMNRRCHNPSRYAFKWYGAKGIIVCDRWRNSFENFFNDMGPRPKDMTLERKDSNGNYEPRNCVWASQRDQSRNRSNNKLTLADAKEIARLVRGGYRNKQLVADKFGVSRALVRRIASGEIWPEATDAN